MGLNISPLSRESWQELVCGYLGEERDLNFPDLVWNKDHIESKNRVIRAMSLTELPQMTWRSCFQSVFEYPNEFIASLKFSVPDRKKIKRQLETKRRVSHALSITSSLEIRNIESNSILHSSEETLERILVNKETLFEMSLAFILLGTKEETLRLCSELEKGMTGIANAGLYSETLGSLPVLSSHFPGAKMLPIRKLPILSENLADILPLMMDFSRSNDSSPLRLQSRNGEISHLNQFSKANLNFNFFVCGASGSGKSFLMNAIISSMIDEDAKTRVCIFDVGGSYNRTIEHHDGKTATLTTANAHSLLASYLRLYPAQASNACTLVESLAKPGDVTSELSKAITARQYKAIELTEFRSADFFKDEATNLNLQRI